jgi:predicted nucleotidyltransferase component of viral defense system
VVKNVENVEKEIAILVKESPLFHEVTHDKRVHKFVRMIAHYKGPLGSEGTVFIDLNERAKTVLKEENHKIPHYYPENIPPFSVTTLAKKEMMAEKMAATIGRNKPRDHFDLYMILKHKHDIAATGKKKYLRDTRYLDIHGEADIAHATQFLSAVEEEAEWHHTPKWQIERGVDVVVNKLLRDIFLGSTNN